MADSFVRRLGGVYLAIWMLLAIAPSERSTWLLENLLVVGLVGLLYGIRRRFVFSNLSCLLIFLFLVLHAVGAHSTYSLAFPGFWLRDAFGLERNPYDRIVHFAFGLLFAYPLRELSLRVLHVHRAWSYVVPVLALLALSSGYEILESWAARVVQPEIGLAFVGAQGDVWDGQKDMSLAFAGALLATAATAAYRRKVDHEPYQRLLGQARPAR
ncbi:MAG: DUF2238 domain-containing protein [Myxococcota bacterium]